MSEWVTGAIKPDARHYSLVVERQPCKLKVLGSIPSGGSLLVPRGRGHEKFGIPHSNETFAIYSFAAIAQLGERQTEDLEVPGSIPGLGIYFCLSHQRSFFARKLNSSRRGGLMV